MKLPLLALTRNLRDRIERLSEQVKACRESGKSPAEWYPWIDQITRDIVFHGEAVAHWVEDNRHPGEAREFRDALQSLREAVLSSYEPHFEYPWVLAESLVDDLERWADEMEGEPKPSEATGGMTWPEAQDAAERIRQRGEPFESYRKTAETIGCSLSVLHNAIHKHGTVELQEWASKQRGASRKNAAPEVAAVAFESTPQGREPNPANALEQADIDAAMAYLLEQAGPNEQARIYAMTPAKRRKLAETAYRDPDTEEQILRHQRAKRSRGD